VLHAQFGLHEMMVLGLALRKALGDTRVSHFSYRTVQPISRGRARRRAGPSGQSRSVLRVRRPGSPTSGASCSVFHRAHGGSSLTDAWVVTFAPRLALVIRLTCGTLTPPLFLFPAMRLRVGCYAARIAS
jgi:hypothetical protein